MSHETWSPADTNDLSFRYIEINGVNTATGEVNPVEVSVTEAPSRARMRVRSGDIIVSLTRPHYGAIALIDNTLDGCIASTGFAILRDFLIDGLSRSYLLCILRCKVSLMQMQQRSSGGNYPAITEEELKRIAIPVPDLEVQQKIATEIANHHKQARRLREEARIIWDEAKHRFEEELLGPELGTKESRTGDAKGGRNQ